MNIEVLFTYMINGLRAGFIYGTVVTGYNLLTLVTGMMHWAHSHLIVLAMYMAWFIFAFTQGSTIFSICIAIVSGILVSTLIGPLFLPFIKRHTFLEGFVVSLGIAIIVTEVMSHWLNSGNGIVFPPSFGGQQTALKIGMAFITYGDLITILGSIILVFSFFYFQNRTKQGRMLRAVAQDTNVARILGISATKMSLLSFAIAGLMGGITAVFLALTLNSASASTGDTIAIKCLAILLFASVGNLRGGLICALILGVAESLTVGYIGGQWVNAVAFSVIVLILLFKPQGIFGPQY